MTHDIDQLAALRRARYALLRTRGVDGALVATPIWFHLDGETLVFRTKRGPKTRRIEREPAVDLQACDHRGRAQDRAPVVRGRASILDGDAAEQANRRLQERYGWQWNVIPLVRIPGVTNVHRGLRFGERVRRARSRVLWPDSAIVQVDLVDARPTGP